MSIGLYIVLAPLYLKSVRKLQEKRFVFVKILAIIIPENGAKVSKIKCFQFAQQTLIEDGYITCETEKVWGKELIYDLKTAEITPEGIAYVCNNSLIEKAKEFLKDIKEITPFI